MDSYENEASKFAAQRTKLKNICEAHDLTYTFIKNSYPIKLIIRPIKGVGEQMSMLETASEDSYISPDAYLLFTMKDGVLVYRMSKTFTIEDALFGKIKNIFKNMHYLWLQFFFRDLETVSVFNDQACLIDQPIDGASVSRESRCHVAHGLVAAVFVDNQAQT